jgi:hypothetical protein
VKRSAQESNEHTDWENLRQLATPEGVIVLNLLKTHDQVYSGKSLAQIDAENHEEWTDTLMDVLLREEGEVDTMENLV